ncbi:MAG: type II secretion system protein [Victivallaceae bacterium]|nr:type II secretion system protein [Victivallaceae bacterium]
MSNKRFTLIEVVAALAILATCAAALLGYCAASVRQISAATRKERDFTMLQQAVEYYLLQGDQLNDPPAEVFDYPGFHPRCSAAASAGMDDALNTSATDLVQLDCLTIEIIRDATGEPVEQIKIDRLHHDDEN